MPSEITGIVRIKERDIKGDLPIAKALTKIKGIGINLANALCVVIEKRMNIKSNQPIGSLTEEQIKEIEKIINSPKDYGVPEYLFNRRKHFETGKDEHLTGEDLTLAVKMDITREKELNTWRGFRHTYGQKVRGQRTRTTGRTGMTVGVMKKAIAEKLKGSKGGSEESKSKSEKKEEKK